MKKRFAVSALVLLVLTAVLLCVPCAADGTEAATTAADEYADMGGFASPERLAMAGQMILEGLGLVFLSLAILWGVLVIFKKIMHDAPMKKAEEQKKKKPVNEVIPDDEEVPVTFSDNPAPAEDDGPVVAAITAAIAAAIASDEALSAQFASGFRVVSFKKKNTGSAWNR